MLTEPNTPVFYNSLYRQRLDEKRRLTIPAKWRPAAEEFEFTLFMWPYSPIQKPYLLVLPPQPLKELVDKFRTMAYSDPKADTLRRLLGKNSEQVVVDKGGRICLPEHMTSAAGIDKEVVLVGSWDRFEIWSPERYDAVSALDDALSQEAFKLI
jgi:MraZ protein